MADSRDGIVIVAAARTPVGSFNGVFSTTPAHQLGSIAIGAALQRARLEPGDADEVILGQILTGGQGMN
ncbi:MAG: acetyl-CoA C-acetyltransferase, partial [Acetobacteraceae bacterium]